MTAPTPPINYALLKRLGRRPHPLLHINEDLEKQIHGVPIEWVGEMFAQARTSHHLLDLVGVPQRDPEHVYASDLDARTFVAVMRLNTARDQLGRIASWHSREIVDGGMVGHFCNECGKKWPCETRRMADGTHEDLKTREELA